MDTQPVIIGSGSRFGRGNQNPSGPAKKNSAHKKPRHAQKPREFVDVWTGDLFVATVPLPLLTRFSTNAAKVFPRTKEEQKHESRTNGSIANEALSPAEEKSANLKVVKLPKSTEKLTVTQSPDSVADGTSPTRELFLGFADKEPSSVAAVQICLNWMLSNKDVHGTQPLISLEVPEQHTFPGLVNVYSAILCLDLRPFPHQVRSKLMEEISNHPLSAADMQYVYERVPDKDVVLTRMVTSMVEKDEEGLYSDEERHAIWEVVKDSELLTNRFHTIEQKRKTFKRRDAAKAREEAMKTGMRNAWKKLDESVGGAEKKATVMASEVAKDLAVMVAKKKKAEALPLKDIVTLKDTATPKKLRDDRISRHEQAVVSAPTSKNSKAKEAAEVKGEVVGDSAKRSTSE